jgi:hypothetical protein
MRLFPSELAAREARADEAQARRAAGETLWQPTPTLALTRWFEQQWLSQWPLQQLFNQTQLLALWLAVVEADARPLIAPRACARLALAADQLAHRYGLDPERGSAYTEEQQAFRRWRREVHRRLQRLDGISAAELPARIARPAAAQTLILQPAAAWDALSPVEREALQRCGAGAPAAPPAAVLPSAQVYADAAQQYRGLAEALRAAYPQAPAEGPRRILLALPDPEAARRPLEAALIDVLAPWAREPGLSNRLPWRWARGPALAETAAADALLGLARLDLSPRPLADWQTLLLHPALGEAEDRIAAAALERRRATKASRGSALPSWWHAQARRCAHVCRSWKRCCVRRRRARCPAPGQRSFWNATARCGRRGWPRIRAASRSSARSRWPADASAGWTACSARCPRRGSCPGCATGSPPPFPPVSSTRNPC